MSRLSEKVLTPKYELNSLFKIETNRDFKWEKATLTREENSRIRTVAEQFNLGSIRNIWVMTKRNKATTLYRLESQNGDWVLRSSAESEKKWLEAQSRVVNQLEYRNITKPIETIHGNFVFCESGHAWMAYSCQPGEIFSGAETNLIEIIRECVLLLESLRKVPVSSDLPSVAHFRFEASSFSEFVSEPARELLSQNLEIIKEWADQVLEISPVTGLLLTHNDLNHANTLIVDSKPFFLDIEDICLEDPNIALGHAIFKLLRHAVYSGHRKVEEMRGLLPKIFEIARAANFKIRDQQSFFRYAVFRILSDIQMILERLRNPEGNQMPTDLEKKIMNLFELHALVYGN